MDIRHLEYFIEVAKHLNFTKAASALHISQPSLSKTIKNMEEELGVPLFYRAFRQLELTDAGKALLHNAKKVLLAYEQLTSELNDVMELKKGEIKIGIPPIIGAAFCSNIISHYIDLFPLVDVTLTEVGTKKIKDGIDDSSLDVGFVCNNPHYHKGVESIQILKDPLMLVAHKNHPLCENETVTLANLEQEAFIMYRQDFSLYDSIIERCSAEGFFPHIVCESSQKDFIIEMVEAKLGIALLPSQICKKLNDQSIKTVPFENPEIFLELGMIWKKDKYLSFSVREFIKVAKSFSVS